MELRWDLDQLFTSFESKEFQNSLNKLDEYIDKINQWVATNLHDQEDAVQKLEEYITLNNDFTSCFLRLNAFARLTMSTDVTNDRALQTLELLDNKRNEITESVVRLERWVGELNNLEKLISASALLTEHSFYLRNIARQSKYLLSNELEVLIAQMSNTGSKAWAKLQNKLVSTLSVDITLDGEEKQLPLPVVRNLAYHARPEVRKNAYQAELKAYEKIEEGSAAALNGIKGEVITVANMKGYESPLHETLLQSKMEKETLVVMFEAIRESLPTFRQYFRKKAELLGYRNGLPFYEMFAPVGTGEKEFTYQEAREFIVKNFRTFTDRLADFADNAFAKRWIDAEPRQGKRGGAFCSNIHPIKESRILMNFNGTFNNVTTLAHELGHGYHGLCLITESVANSRYPMPLAETASIFAETIVVNAALETATQEEAFSILESSVSTAGQVIVDIYSRFLFEDELFNRRKDYSLSVKELKDLMVSAQKEAYGEGLDPEYLHPYMWVNKSHYYSADRNYYNFPYAFGLLFALGLYSEYLKQGDAFVENYDDLLRATGSMSIIEATKMVGIDVNSIDFWRSSLGLIVKDIEKFIELADALNK